jgi:hypothetical protein
MMLCEFDVVSIVRLGAELEISVDVQGVAATHSNKFMPSYVATTWAMLSARWWIGDPGAFWSCNR